MTLATPLPMGINSCAEMPSFHATASIGSMLAARAISRSEAIASVRLNGSLKPSPAQGEQRRVSPPHAKRGLHSSFIVPR